MSAKPRTVVVDLRKDEVLRVGDATITLREKSGQRARLVVVAGPAVNVEPPAREKTLRERLTPT